MKTLALALGLITTSAFAQLNYSNTADVSPAHKDIRISDVRYVAIATKTEVREIPGCVAGGERHPIECQETVVLERTPVVQVTVSYTEGVFWDPDMPEGHVFFNFKLSDFEASEISELRGASTLWDFGAASRVRKAFAKRNFDLKAELATRTIQIVDVRNSKLCPIGEVDSRDYGCVEELVYKPAKTTVRELTVIKK